MTVSELIERLSKYPSNMEVFAGECHYKEFKVVNAQKIDDKFYNLMPFVELDLIFE